MGQDFYIAPGTKVHYSGCTADSGEQITECGVVVHCWHEKSIHAYDCLVAFFGESFPDGEPSEKPYILRYAAMSLDVLTD